MCRKFVRVLYYFAGINVLLWSCSGLPEGRKGGSENFPETKMSTCDVIKFHEYLCEEHDVMTKDGYILQLHRIPAFQHGGNDKIDGTNAVFLQHGIIDSSYTWVMNGPSESLAYILANQGYDVWMGNTRGNTYSTRHKVLDHKSEKFWDFSWDEMVKFDLPASIEYVLKQTNQSQLFYIGHAQGTLIGFAAFSMYPSLGEKIKLFAALAPTAHVSHVKGLLKILSYGGVIGEQILATLGTRNFLPSSWVTREVAKLVCGHGIFQYICTSIVFLISGYDVTNLDKNRIPVIMTHTPAGTSVKNIIHFSQMIRSNKLQMYDYKWNGNMHKYMQPYPPTYDIEQMSVPVALFTGTADWLATPEDIDMYLRPFLPNLIYDQTDKFWNHVDFVWGKNANEIIYENVISLLKGIQPTETVPLRHPARKLKGRRHPIPPKPPKR